MFLILFTECYLHINAEKKNLKLKLTAQKVANFVWYCEC